MADVIMDRGHFGSIAEFQDPEQLYAELIEKVRKYHPSDDISMIEKAYATALNAHEGQQRKSGSTISYIRCAWRSSWPISRWIKRP